MLTTETLAAAQDELWDTSLPDWKVRLAEGRSMVPDLPLFDKVADKALAVFKRLRVPDMIGHPTYGEVCGPWVFDFVRAVFGSYDPERKVRMIREFFLLVPKGNAKSTIAAAIIVTAAILNERPNAELLLIAPTQKIAKISYNQAAGIVRLDPKLRDMFDPKSHENAIDNLNPAVPSRIIIKSADPSVVTGSLATFTLIDETHVFSTISKAADVFAEIKGALGKRPDGFLLQITTQSKRPPAGVFRTELDIARDVRDGKLRRSMLAVLYELPPEVSANGGWRDPTTWKMVNPNLDRSITSSYIAGEIQKADREGPEALALVASQHLNVEIGINLRTNRWAGAEFWNKRARQGLDLAHVLGRSEVVVVGIDGGGLDDLFGLSVLGRERETRDWLAWAHGWCHEGVLQRRKSIAPLLRDFEAAGDLTIVGDELADISEIVAIIAEAKDLGILASVAVDPAGLGEMIEALAEIEVTQEAGLLIGAPQGYQMMNAIKTAERKLANGTLWHSGSSMMAWCVGNLKIEPTATAVRATKQTAGDAKIDPVMALFDAVTVMSRVPEAAAVATAASMIF